MDTKKDKTRYTIKFNPTDLRHQEAMKALDGAGRRKASLIADALCMYNYNGADMGFTPLVSNIHNTNPTQHQDKPTTVATQLSNAVEVNDDDIWQSINESLAEFQ